jgi:hypothetical protein
LTRLGHILSMAFLKQGCVDKGWDVWTVLLWLETD